MQLHADRRPIRFRSLQGYSARLSDATPNTVALSDNTIEIALHQHHALVPGTLLPAAAFLDMARVVPVVRCEVQVGTESHIAWAIYSLIPKYTQVHQVLPCWS